MQWVVTYTDDKGCDRSYIHENDHSIVLNRFVNYLKRFQEDVRVFRVEEEIDLTVAYPDYFGGDDSG